MSTFRTDLVATIPSLRSFAFSLTRNVDARDDLVQQTMIRALAKENLFRPGTSVGAWARTMLYNLHINNVRRLARQGRGIPIDDLHEELTSDLPDQDAAMRRRDFWRAIEKLPKTQADVLIADIHGYTPVEIASRFHIAIGTTKSRSSRACASLRALIAGEVASVPQRAVRS